LSPPLPVSPSSPLSPPRPLAEGEEREELSKLRQTLARRLVDAQHATASLTTFNEVDLSAVIALREKYKDLFEKLHGIGLGFMSFFAKAVVYALQTVPQANYSLDGNTLIKRRAVHLGIAVATDRGLVVPVLQNAHNLSMAQIESEIKRLAAKARDGKITVDEMAGGTFTITNGGVFGSLLSTPILNPPQSAILGMHKIEKRPVVIQQNGQDTIAIRSMMYLALTYDHRVLDGKQSVTFLAQIKEALEDPARIMLGV
jgi:2-oxoglutarate dehydrogenase E2 component (dihydrolipoamide succinyltransferase)